MAETKNPVGRPRNIQDPDQLWELFEKYKNDTKSTPRFKVESSREGLIKIPLEVPLIMVGFYNYCRRRVGEVRQYFLNDSAEYKEFLTICRAIRDEIEQDQIEGGMVNIYNPSITQRLNGLVDKQEKKVEVVEFPSPIIELPNE
jgi:hypothetical protein